MRFIYLAVLFLGIGQLINASQPNKLKRSASAPAYLGSRLQTFRNQLARTVFLTPGVAHREQDVSQVSEERKARVIQDLIARSAAEAYALSGQTPCNPSDHQCSCDVCCAARE